LLRENARPSWQKEIYRNHFKFKPKAQKYKKIDILRAAALLLLPAILMSIYFSNYSLERMQNFYLLLLEQHLPGMSMVLKNESEPAGFRGTGISPANDTPSGTIEEREKERPSAEHLLAIYNETGRSRSVRTPVSALSADRFIPVNTAPRILIYHTHATESFLPVSGKAFSSDPQKSVVFLGEYLAEVLERQHGIAVLHHRQIFDIPRSTAYAQALPVITAILEENPQINLVVDLHRDGISRDLTTIPLNGKNTARILFVVGTNHEGWGSNLRFAIYLQNVLDQKYPGLCRGVRRLNFTYNQHIHPRSVLVEIGSHENKKEEVMRAVPYLAEALAEVF
jgi:stage II sporulation protein P